MRTFGRILIAGWMLIIVAVLFFNIFPRFVSRIAPAILETIRPILLIFILIAAVYGVAWLYRQGMKRARRN